MLGELMKKMMIGASAVIALALSGCATVNYNAEPMALGGQKLTYEQGVGTLASTGKDAVVRAKLVSVNAATKEITIALAVVNNSETAFNVGSENVSAQLEGGESLRVFSASELQAIAKKRAKAAAFAVALAGALETASNQYSATSTTTGTYRSSSGYTSSYTATTTNPYLAARLNRDTQARTSANLEQIDDLLDQKLSRIQGETLQTTTVNPGEVTGGETIIATPKTLSTAKAPIEIVVSMKIQNDTHTFRFKIAKQTL